MRFSIFKKGLLLITFPLIIQAAVLGMLIQTQAETTNAQRWAVHTKDVIAKVEDIYRRLLEGFAGARLLVVSDSQAASQPFRDAPDQIAAQIGYLRDLTADNRSQQARIEKLTKESRAFVEWLDAEEERIKSGERGKALDMLEDGTRLLSTVRTTTDAILLEEAQLDEDRLRHREQTTDRQLRTAIIGGAVFLGTTLALTLLFLKRVIKRLAVLRENAHAYAAGRRLGAPLAGGDEIAEVDHAFHQMAASLDQQKQENEMFVYSVSHDLRSPLINLQGFSEELSFSCRDLEALFQRADIPSDIRRVGSKIMTENMDESIRFIQAAVGRLARIIDSLLRLSRAGRVEYQWQSVDLASTVPKIVDALRDSISLNKAEVTVHELPRVWGDPTAIEQIFANLISNAVHYLDPARSGRIEVGIADVSLANQMTGFAVIYVKDNGLGIAEAYHQRVFAVFNRLHANVVQGEGVGLALTRRMVERHGGKIWVESSANVGTTFFVALPGQPSERDRPAVPARVPATQAP
jgi:signal transduction histidine kinase